MKSKAEAAVVHGSDQWSQFKRDSSGIHQKVTHQMGSFLPNIADKKGEEGLYTVLRYFLLDSMADENHQAAARSGTAGLYRSTSGVMKVIGKLYSFVKVPIIAEPDRR